MGQFDFDQKFFFFFLISDFDQKFNGDFAIYPKNNKEILCKEEKMKQWATMSLPIQ